MRFPSLFKLPQHQQFEIKPRYYDPVKEFVEQRRAVVKGREGMEDGLPEMTRIRFERRKSSAGLSTSLLQLIIALVLSVMIVGWLYFGNDMLYVALVGIPLYLFLRLRRKR